MSESDAPTPRLGRDAWAEAALDVIRRHGVQAVAVEPLAAQLGVTKGSFYWHFKNRDELIQTAMERWERFHRFEFIPRFEGITDPVARLRVLMYAAFEDTSSGMLFAALSSSSEDPRVRPALERVSNERMDFGVAAFMALGFPEEQARQRALLLYSAYAGYFHLLRVNPAMVTAVTDLSPFVHQLLDSVVPRGAEGSQA